MFNNGSLNVAGLSSYFLFCPLAFLDLTFELIFIEKSKVKSFEKLMQKQGHDQQARAQAERLPGAAELLHEDILRRKLEKKLRGKAIYLVRGWVSIDVAICFFVVADSTDSSTVVSLFFPSFPYWSYSST